MHILTEVVRNIVVILLFTTFLQMLLPSHSMQRFIKVAMGLFVLISFLNPVLDLLNRVQQEDLAVWTFQQANPHKINFRERVEQQIAAMLKMVHGVQEPKVKVQLAQNGANVQRETIEEVLVTIEDGNRGKDPGDSLFDEEGGSAPAESELVYTVCRYFGLQENQVRVVFH